MSILIIFSSRSRVQHLSPYHVHWILFSASSSGRNGYPSSCSSGSNSKISFVVSLIFSPSSVIFSSHYPCRTSHGSLSSSFSSLLPPHPATQSTCYQVLSSPDEPDFSSSCNKQTSSEPKFGSSSSSSFISSLFFISSNNGCPTLKLVDVQKGFCSKLTHRLYCCQNGVLRSCCRFSMSWDVKEEITKQ